MEHKHFNTIQYLWLMHFYCIHHEHIFTLILRYQTRRNSSEQWLCTSWPFSASWATGGSWGLGVTQHLLPQPLLRGERSSCTEGSPDWTFEMEPAGAWVTPGHHGNHFLQLDKRWRSISNPNEIMYFSGIVSHQHLFSLSLFMHKWFASEINGTNTVTSWTPYLSPVFVVHWSFFWRLQTASL